MSLLLSLRRNQSPPRQQKPSRPSEVWLTQSWSVKSCSILQINVFFARILNILILYRDIVNNCCTNKALFMTLSGASSQVKSSQNSSQSKAKSSVKPASIHSRLGLPISSDSDRGRSSKESLPQRKESFPQRMVQRPLSSSSSASKRSVSFSFSYLFIYCEH